MIEFATDSYHSIPQGVVTAVDTVDASMREIADATIARLRKNSGKPGAQLQAGSARVRVNMDRLYKAVMACDEAETVGPLVTKHLREWLGMLDDSADHIDDFMLSYKLGTRAHRRKYDDWFEALKKVERDVLDVKNLVIELLEHFDPTPEDYLEQEIRSIHGDQADMIMGGFSEIASSGHFSLNAFKRRHHLK